jgi:ElaB/YqjD/DUF883 family membrane-anchored ribosome-binding protein
MASRNVQTGTENAHPMADQVAARAHEVVDRAAETAREVEARARDVATTSMEKLEVKQAQARQQVDATVSRIATFIREEPVAAAGVAFAIGIFAAALLRRN